jgi:hypothetical protein
MANGKATRLNLTVSFPMRVALEVLAERSNLGVATQAMVLLRQALDRTMNTEEVRRRVASHVAQRGATTWREDTVIEHATETAFTQFGNAAGETTDALEREGDAARQKRKHAAQN